MDASIAKPTDQKTVQEVATTVESFATRWNSHLWQDGECQRCQIADPIDIMRECKAGCIVGTGKEEDTICYHHLTTLLPLLSFCNTTRFPTWIPLPRDAST